jgi:hypothetical protein
MGKFLKFLSESKISDLLTPMAPDEVPYSWHKRSDGSYDVDGNVDLSDQKLKKIPWKFNKVTGDFYCYYNQLTSLEGCPKEVGGGFSCHYNQLTSLEGCPKEVGGHFYCHNNQLTSLEGCPKEVGGHFSCSYNQLTSLEGCPKEVGRDFCCHNNKKEFSKEEVKRVCKVKGIIYV